MMKKLLALPVLAVALLIAGLYWFFVNSKPVSTEETFKDFLIVKGSGASLVGNNLHKEGLIKNPLAFKVYAQITGRSGRIQAGEYRLSPSFNLFELFNQLGKGPTEIWVTIPEGLRREEIAKRFADSLSKDEAFVEEFLSSSVGEEGYLFPDTYLFPKTASASAVVSKMTATFASKTADLDLTKNQVILASLIERETKTADERPIVAGIILNRLNAGWPLQIDASVQYGVGTEANWWPILTREDISSSSPYNSYKFAGLPPAPIANAGITSLEAAANPEDSDYWYYIHAPNGQIYYAETLAEHNENIRKYLTR
jgi:UPF0755 protein